MENRSHAIVAVVFLLVFSIGSVAVFFWFESTHATGKTYVIVTGKSVSGLSSQSPVKFKGITIGRVQDVAFAPDDPTRIRIVFGVKADAYVTHATYAELPLQGVTGGHYVELKIDPKGDRRPLHTSDDKPARIPLRPSLLGRLMDNGKQDMTRISDIIASIHKLLDPQTRAHLDHTIAQLDAATHALVSAEHALQPTIRQLPELVRSSRRLVADARKLMTAARQPVARSSKLEASLQRLSDATQTMTDKLSRETLPQIGRLTEHLDRSARHLDQLSEELKNKPQSIIFGPPERMPGPGEPGFNPNR